MSYWGAAGSQSCWGTSGWCFHWWGQSKDRRALRVDHSSPAGSSLPHLDLGVVEENPHQTEFNVDLFQMSVIQSSRKKSGRCYKNCWLCNLLVSYCLTDYELEVHFLTILIYQYQQTLLTVCSMDIFLKLAVQAKLWDNPGTQLSKFGWSCSFVHSRFQRSILQQGPLVPTVTHTHTLYLDRKDNPCSWQHKKCIGSVFSVK